MALSKITSDSIQDTAIHGRRNLIINGAMTISQRGTDFNDVSNGTYTIDRWKLGKNNTDNAVINIDRVTTSPDGFSNSLKISVGTAESALAADESLLLQHLIEAQNLQHLQNGSSGAQSVTLSFWVRSDKTGTYTVAIRKPDNTDRNQSKEYTISAADTWEHKSLTFSGDTSGGGIANDNGAGFFCDWWLAGGSNLTGGTMDTWANTATQRLSTNQVNLMDGTNEWYITGVQLEVGQATPFEHRSYGEELSLCQRYFAYAHAGIIGGAVTATHVCLTYYPRVEFRAMPTLSLTAPLRVDQPAIHNKTQSSADISHSFSHASAGAINMYFGNFSGMTRSDFYVMRANGDIHFDAEL